jgi:hypothetical protein
MSKAEVCLHLQQMTAPHMHARVTNNSAQDLLGLPQYLNTPYSSTAQPVLAQISEQECQDLM